MLSFQLRVRHRVADDIRAARAHERLKQDEVADAMQALGFDTFSRATLSEIERYRRRVTVEELAGLARVLGTNLYRDER